MTVTSIGLSVILGDHLASIRGVRSAFGLPEVDLSAQKTFTFRRRRTEGVWGWEVGLCIGRFWVNLSCGDRAPAPFLRTLDDARRWAVDFATLHGFKPMQAAKKKRTPPRPRLRVIRGGREEADRE